MDEHDADVRLDVGEELDALAEMPVGVGTPMSSAIASRMVIPG